MEFTNRIEEFTGGTPGWYAGMMTKVDVTETVRQVRVLACALEKLDEGS